MTFELLISTMHKTKEQVIEMLQIMNLKCDCVIVNQCNLELYENIFINNQQIKIIYTKERGLSRSRNMAIKFASADVVGIADDDLFYYNNFDKEIINYYQKNQKADIVIFNMDDCYKCFSNKEKKCNFLSLSGYKSMQLTFKLNSIKNNGIQYNIIFGTGSDYYQSGEENIFLADSYRKKLKIYYSPSKILKRDISESSWFHGYDESFIRSRGAIYYAMSSFLYPLYLIRFAIKMCYLQKTFSFFKTIKIMQQEKRRYKNMNKN